MKDTSFDAWEKLAWVAFAVVLCVIAFCAWLDCKK